MTGKVQSGSIVLFHNAGEHTPEALPDILNYLLSEGYDIVPISKILLSGDYTIQRPVMFVTGAEVTASEQAFIDYIFSQVGYDVVEANGYIPAFTPEA